MGFPWYAFYPAKYRKRTAGLSMVQDGAYRRLMDHYYETAEPLPANAEQLLRICSAFDEAERAAVLHVVKTYFVQADDGWHHPVIDDEIAKRLELSEKRAAAGSAGGKSGSKTGGKRKAKGKQVLEQLHEQLLPQEQLQEHLSSLRSDRAATPPLAPKKPEGFQIPDWVPAAAWAAFVEMRKKIRRPLTDYAAEKIVAKLSKLKTLGHDPAEVLDQSIIKSWRDVFPIKTDRTDNGRQQQPAHNSFAASVSRVTRRRNPFGDAALGGEVIDGHVTGSGPVVPPEQNLLAGIDGDGR